MGVGVSKAKACDCGLLAVYHLTLGVLHGCTVGVTVGEHARVGVGVSKGSFG